MKTRSKGILVFAALLIATAVVFLIALSSSAPRHRAFVRLLADPPATNPAVATSILELASDAGGKSHPSGGSILVEFTADGPTAEAAKESCQAAAEAFGKDAEAKHHASVRVIDFGGHALPRYHTMLAPIGRALDRLFGL